MNQKRPILVWIISILFFVAFIANLFIYIKFGNEMMKSKFTIVDLSISLLCVFINTAGAFFLFQLKKQCINIFIFSILLSLLSPIYHFINGSFISFYKGTEVNVILGILVWVGFFYYLWHLKNKNVLS